MVLLAKVAKLTKGEVEKKRRKQEFLCKSQKTGSDTQVSFINCSDIYMVKPTENWFIYSYLPLIFFRMVPLANVAD